MSRVLRNATEADSTTANAAIEKEYSYFDLESLEEKSEKVSISFVPATSYKEAVERLGNDEAKLTAALNAQLRSDALSAAEASVKSKGARRAVVFAFIKPMRAMKPFDAIEDRKKQTAAILEQVKTVPFLLEGLKSLAAKDTGTGDEGDEAGE